MTSDRDRLCAFAVGAACLVGVLAALLLLGPQRGGVARPGGSGEAAAGEPAAAPPRDAAVSGRPAADPTAAADDPAPAGPPAVMPAGQELSHADVRALRAGPPTAPAAVRAAARRFVEAYLVYELGSPPAALHDRIMALTGGRLRAALQHEPPRRPLGTRLGRWRLSALDGDCARRDPAAAPRCEITYVVRRDGRFLPHAISLEKGPYGWLVTDLIG